MPLAEMPTLSPQRQSEIEALVDRVKLVLGLSYPADSLLAFADALNIEVKDADFSQFPNVGGAVKAEDKEGVAARVLLNREHPPVRKTFTLAHEIGHFLLHKPTVMKWRVDKVDYSEPESLDETEANFFAATLLVPKHELLKLYKATLAAGFTESQAYAELAKHFGVSAAVIENRFKWLRSNPLMPS